MFNSVAARNCVGFFLHRFMQFGQTCPKILHNCIQIAVAEKELTEYINTACFSISNVRKFTIHKLLCFQPVFLCMSRVIHSFAFTDSLNSLINGALHSFLFILLHLRTPLKDYSPLSQQEEQCSPWHVRSLRSNSYVAILGYW